MKTNVIIVFLFLFSFSVIQAQEKEKRHDISAGYGIVNTDEVLGVTTSIFTSIITLAHANRTNMKWSGLYNLGYKYRFGKMFPVGIAVGYEQMSADLTDNDQVVLATEKGQLITVMLRGSIRYVNKRVFQMYSGLSVGYTFANYVVTEDDGTKSESSNNHFNGQVNLIGLRVGTVVGGFLELGFGAKGIINFGLSCQF